MKKLLTVLLIFCLASSLVACDGKDEKKSEKVTKKTEETMILPDDVSVDMDKGAFSKGTIIKIEKVKKGKVFDFATTALKSVAKRFVAYDITATKDNTTVQPNGTVKVTFPITKDYDLERVCVVYISKDGVVENISSTVDSQNRTITAELSHFSIYAVIESIEGNVNGEDLSPDTTANPSSTSSTCSHTYIDATCTAPKICSKCKEIGGAALGHNYSGGACTRCGSTDSDYKYPVYVNGVGYDLGTKITIDIVLKTNDKAINICPTYMFYQYANNSWTPLDIMNDQLEDLYGEEPIMECSKGGTVLTDNEEIEYGLWRWMASDSTTDFSKGETIIRLKYTLSKEGDFRISVQDGRDASQNNNKYTKSLSLNIHK